MRLQDFHFELFERASATQQISLRELRQEVFATAGIAAPACAQTGDESTGWHVLVRDRSDHALGFGSLADDGTIECVAVREGSRRQGIGTAILRELIARARTLGMQEISLDAPVGALDFCRSAGFTTCSSAAGDAGKQRHTLTLPTLRQTVDTPEMHDLGSLPAAGRSEVAAARLQLLADTRYQLLIYAPTLHDDLFGNAAELEQLRRIACSGRTASIRVLLHDPGAAVANDHPLLPLAQRLPTAFQIRTPTEAADLTYAGAYLLNDSGGYLFLPDASRLTGRAARHHRTAQAPLRQHFSEAWERAERATILNTLDL